MSTIVIVQRDQPGLYAGHLAEARRALKAQGHDRVEDETVSRALWAARALPVAIDALSDTRSGARLDNLEVAGLRVLQVPDGGAPVEGALVAVAVHKTGSDKVEVRFVPPGLASAAEATRAMSAAVVELEFVAERSMRPVPDPADDDVDDSHLARIEEEPAAETFEITDEKPVVQRFTHGKKPGERGPR